MLRIEVRQMYRSNGLIDDLLVYGLPEDYVQLSKRIEAAITSPDPVGVNTDSAVRLEISMNNQLETLFTSLQNEENEYFSIDDWSARDVLRVVGPKQTLKKLSAYFQDISARGEGYSYISEFSNSSEYSEHSPEWRLHVQKN